jgi:hypothetical protein
MAMFLKFFAFMLDRWADEMEAKPRRKKVRRNES